MIVWGTRGSGKTILARELGAALALPVRSLSAVLAAKRAGSILGELADATDLMGEALAERWARSCETVLAAAKDEPACIIDADIPLSIFAGHERAILALQSALRDPFLVVVHSDDVATRELLEARSGAPRRPGIVDPEFDVLERLLPEANVVVRPGDHPVGAAASIVAKLGGVPKTSLYFAHDLPDVDRRSWLRYRALQRLLLPEVSDLLDDLSALHTRQRARTLGYLETAVDLRAPLTAPARALVARCAADAAEVSQIDRSTTVLGNEDRIRASALTRYRLAETSCLEDVFNLDPFHRVVPLDDVEAVARLPRVGDLDQDELLELRRAVVRRLLRMPQRSGYLLLHELVVAEYERRIDDVSPLARLRLDALAPHSAAALPAYLLDRCVELASVPAQVMRALHFADEATIERALPSWFTSFLTAAATVLSFAEAILVYRSSYHSTQARLLVMHEFIHPALDAGASLGDGIERGISPRLGERIRAAWAPLMLSPPSEARLVGALRSLATRTWARCD